MHFQQGLQLTRPYNMSPTKARDATTRLRRRAVLERCSTMMQRNLRRNAKLSGGVIIKVALRMLLALNIYVVSFMFCIERSMRLSAKIQKYGTWFLRRNGLQWATLGDPFVMMSRRESWNKWLHVQDIIQVSNVTTLPVFDMLEDWKFGVLIFWSF